MNCIFAEKVSTLVDGELSEAESRHVREHLADCDVCAAAEKEFLFLRRQIKASANDALAAVVTTPPLTAQSGWSLFQRKSLVGWFN